MMKEAQVEKSESSSTLNRILLNALEHFSNFGYSGASVREITHAAHVTKPTLYYYFKNKEELYRGLVQSCSDKIFTALFDALKTPGTMTERFMNLVQAQNNLCESDLPAVKFIFLISFSPARNLPDVGIAQFNKRLDEMVENLVEAAVQKNEFQSERRECVSLVLKGLLSFNISSRLAGVPVSTAHLEKALNCMFETN